MNYIALCLHEVLLNCIFCLAVIQIIKRFYDFTVVKIDWMLTQSKFCSCFRRIFNISICKKLSDKLKSAPVSDDRVRVDISQWISNFQTIDLPKRDQYKRRQKQRYHRSWLNTTEHTILCWSLELILLSVGQRPTILTCPISQNLRTNMSSFRLVLKFMLKPE